MRCHRHKRLPREKDWAGWGGGQKDERGERGGRMGRWGGGAEREKS